MSWPILATKFASFFAISIFDIALTFFLCMGSVALANEGISRVGYGDEIPVCRALCLHKLEAWQFLTLWSGMYALYCVFSWRVWPGQTLGRAVLSPNHGAKRWLFGFALLMASIVLIFVPPFHFMHDEALSDRAKFYAQEGEHIPANENGYFAWIGFGAPENVDIMRFGQDLYARSLTHEITELSSDLEIDLGEKSLECWYMQMPEEEVCASEKEIETLFKRYALYLQRYDQMTSKPFFYEGHPFMPLISQGFIKLFQLKMTWIGYQAKRGATDRAIREWIKVMNFNNGDPRDQKSLNAQAIFSINLISTLRVLPVILASDPGIAKKYKAEIQRILSVPAFGRNGWDFRRTGRIEYRIFNTLFLYPTNNVCNFTTILCLPNAARNSFSEWLDQGVALSKTPPPFLKPFSGGAKEFPASKYYVNTIPSLLLPGMTKGLELFNSRHKHIAIMRLLDLYVEALAEEIPVDRMGAFVLDQAKARRVNPLTGKPFDWDSRRRILTLYNPLQGSSPNFKVLYDFH